MDDVAYLQAVSEATARNRVKDESRDGYNSKIKYCIRFVKSVFPNEIEEVDGVERLKLPLLFDTISALFAKVF